MPALGGGWSIVAVRPRRFRGTALDLVIAGVGWSVEGWPSGSTEPVAAAGVPCTTLGVYCAVLAPLLASRKPGLLSYQAPTPLGETATPATCRVPAAGKAAPGSVWDKIAKCESGNLLSGQLPLVIPGAG
jgi:hypothetical protein